MLDFLKLKELDHTKVERIAGNFIKLYKDDHCMNFIGEVI